MRSTISVIIPVYNVEKYLDRCVKSLCNQTYQQLEIILVDDGSPDNCPSMCDFYEKQDRRIKVIHKVNEGVAAARNTGIRSATGEYVTFVDSDDWLEDDGIELLYRAANEYKVDFVRHRAIRNGWPGLDENAPCMLEEPREIPGGYYNKERIVKEIYYRLLSTRQLTMGTLAGAWSSLYKREFLLKNNLFFHENVKYCEDLLFCANVVKKVNSFYYIDVPGVYHYFYNSNSVSRTCSKNRWASCKSLINACEMDFGKSEDYNFENQLYYLKWFCIFLSLNERKYITNMREREAYCKEILSDLLIRNIRLDLSVVDVSWKQKVLMILVKFKMSKIIARI